MTEEHRLENRAKPELMITGFVASVITLVAAVAIMIDIGSRVAAVICGVMALWCLGVIMIITRHGLARRRGRPGS